MPVIEQKRIARADLRANPDRLYLFGDNDLREGLGGQAAAMRGEPNAVGVRTKAAPNRRPSAYWYDATFESNRAKIVADLAPVREALERGTTVVVPADGIGTGLAALAETAPRTLAFLNAELAKLRDIEPRAAT